MITTQTLAAIMHRGYSDYSPRPAPTEVVAMPEETQEVGPKQFTRPVYVQVNLCFSDVKTEIAIHDAIGERVLMADFGPTDYDAIFSSIKEHTLKLAGSPEGPTNVAPDHKFSPWHVATALELPPAAVEDLNPTPEWLVEDAFVFSPGDDVSTSGIYAEVAEVDKPAVPIDTGRRVCCVEGEPFPPTSGPNMGYALVMGAKRGVVAESSSEDAPADTTNSQAGSKKPPKVSTEGARKEKASKPKGAKLN